MLNAQVLIPVGSSPRGERLLTDLARELHIPVVRRIINKTDFIFTWGPGAPAQVELVKTYPGIVVMFDLGYFYRRKDHLKGCLRMTINAPHPQLFIDIAGDESRWEMHKIPTNDWYDPKGHILLCGIGSKSRKQYGYPTGRWEANTLATIKKVFPGEKVFYRPKPSTPNERLNGTGWASFGTIDHWLKGAKLVICHHSNVAVDCAIQGVPCICTEGVGTLLWPNKITRDIKMPTMEERLAFLHKVAWFDWHPSEVVELAKFFLAKETQIREIASRLRQKKA